MKRPVFYTWLSTSSKNSENNGYSTLDRLIIIVIIINGMLSTVVRINNAVEILDQSSLAQNAYFENRNLQSITRGRALLSLSIGEMW